MRVKIIGIGKCGSRLAYDFFAYISDTPTAYEMRAQNNTKFMSYMMYTFPAIETLNRRLAEFKLNRQKLFQELFGDFLIFDPAELVTLDSDIRNNEIISWIEFINEQGKSFVFPGKSFRFANHSGGCDFHIISENICANWSDIDKEIISDDGVDFIVTAFSIGGGTGGGAAPLISFQCKQYASKSRKYETVQMHFMGVGVLPITNEPYHGEELIPDMSPNERYNTGRFFTNLYGKRNAPDPDLYMDGVWLFSNDALRIATKTPPEDSNELNLSLINKYFSASLTVICNASSKNTKSNPNFDPSEMNNRLNGYPFMSGYATIVPEKLGNEQLHANAVRSLLKLALNNMTFGESSQLYGLSVPVRESNLEEVNRILDKSGFERLRSSLKSYNIEDAPLEFRTASTVVVLYGQPLDTHSPLKDRLISEVVSTLFKNSKVESYYYQYPKGTADKVLVLIINPFIRFIQKSIYSYTQISWANGSAGDELFRIFDEVITEKPFDSRKIERVLLGEEQIHSEFHGESTVQLVNSFPEPSKLDQQCVINAFLHLHKVYHYEKPAPPTSII